MTEPSAITADVTRRAPRGRRRDLAFVAVAIVLAYLAVAYLILPAMWQRHELRHPGLAESDWITRTGDGIPGDPVNLGIVGSEEELHRAMLKAGWYPADPITLRSSLRIASDVVFRRPYVDAPVSNLYLFGRKEDFAFEQPVGDDPSKRHHVRFWRTVTLDHAGRPLWLGAATLDVSVGFSRDTGQITHHIAPDVDRQRDKIISDLTHAGALSAVSWADDLQPLRSGRNGGGDPWRTDGRIAIGILSATAPFPPARPTTQFDKSPA